MKNLFLSIALIGLMLVACNHKAEEKIAVTAKSEIALKYYNDAMIAYEDVYLDRFIDLASKALKEDPDFFMANYRLSLIYLYMENDSLFKVYAAKAADCKADLSEGELLLKEAIGKLSQNKTTDVRDIGKKLIDLFPKDVNAYFNLDMFQWLANDNKGQVETLKKALEITKNPAPVYNMLGYAYLELGQNDDAAKAFDKYIELSPHTPNPYDSKGDYFMKIKDYEQAFQSYTKSHEIDTAWGNKKAMHAKALADSLAGK